MKTLKRRRHAAKATGPEDQLPVHTEKIHECEELLQKIETAARSKNIMGIFKPPNHQSKLWGGEGPPRNFGDLQARVRAGKYVAACPFEGAIVDYCKLRKDVKAMLANIPDQKASRFLLLQTDQVVDQAVSIQLKGQSSKRFSTLRNIIADNTEPCAVLSDHQIKLRRFTPISQNIPCCCDPIPMDQEVDGIISVSPADLLVLSPDHHGPFQPIVFGERCCENEVEILRAWVDRQLQQTHKFTLAEMLDQPNPDKPKRPNTARFDDDSPLSFEDNVPTCNCPGAGSLTIQLCSMAIPSQTTSKKYWSCSTCKFFQWADTAQSSSDDEHPLSQPHITCFLNPKTRRLATTLSDLMHHIENKSQHDISEAREFAEACQRNLHMTTQPLAIDHHILKQLVWGLDCRCRTNIDNTLKYLGRFSQQQVEDFISQLLIEQNKVDPSTAPTDLRNVLHHMCSSKGMDHVMVSGAQLILEAMHHVGHHSFPVFPKGMGIIAISPIPAHTFVGEYVGEVFPAWLWKVRDIVGLSSSQPSPCSPPPSPTTESSPSTSSSGKTDPCALYNILLERPSKLEGGYTFAVVDAGRQGNFCSVMSHSCDANCTAVTMSNANGKLGIGLFSKRTIQTGEELTFDYAASTTEEREWLSCVCLCGSSTCRGSYLYFHNQTNTQKAWRHISGPLRVLVDTIESCDSPSDPPPTQSQCDAFEAYGIGRSCLGESPPAYLGKWSLQFLRFAENERMTHFFERFTALVEEQVQWNSAADLQSVFLDAFEASRPLFESRLQDLVTTASVVQTVLKHGGVSDLPHPSPHAGLTHSHSVFRRCSSEDVVWELVKSPQSFLVRCAHYVNKLFGTDISDFVTSLAGSCCDDSLAHCSSVLVRFRSRLLSLIPSPHTLALSDLLLLLANTKAFYQVSPVSIPPPLANSDLRSIVSNETIIGLLCRWWVGLNHVTDIAAWRCEIAGCGLLYDVDGLSPYILSISLIC
eukprot:c7675_g1_i1.p1 GENE.c7675_g1_i1~~c7675_g1_i1.p1  ORF type:complete len:993 (+),score=212.72 c7675_g1_i1:48-2981(+)